MRYRRPPIERTCAKCRAPLATGHHGARYCSNRCKQADYRARQRGDTYGARRVFVSDLRDLDELLAKVEAHPAFGGTYRTGRNVLGPVETLVRNARKKLSELESEEVLRVLRS